MLLVRKLHMLMQVPSLMLVVEMTLIQQLFQAIPQIFQ